MSEKRAKKVAKRLAKKNREQLRLEQRATTRSDDRKLIEGIADERSGLPGFMRPTFGVGEAPAPVQKPLDPTLLSYFLDGIFLKWHWWHWHFRVVQSGLRVPFVEALFDALLEIDSVIPGYAKRLAAAITAISGPEKHEPHYEQLLQQLAEILVVRQCVRGPWSEPPKFLAEPTAGLSRKNPEITITTAAARYGIEVKAPALLAHERNRGERPVQAPSRAFPPGVLEKVAGGRGKLTLPRDNPVKDFLISANAKFESFRATDPDFFGALVIVWDDFIYEPISALSHPLSGLFTPNSFARNDKGQALEFPNVDGVILISHLQWFKSALAEGSAGRPFSQSHAALTYNLEPHGRPIAYVKNPHGRGLPDALLEVLQALPAEGILGAEYHASEAVFWMNLGDP